MFTQSELTGKKQAAGQLAGGWAPSEVGSRERKFIESSRESAGFYALRIARPRRGLVDPSGGLYV